MSNTMSPPSGAPPPAAATPSSKLPMTPLRNNYAAPNTPIASVKRPRQSIERPPAPATTPARSSTATASANISTATPLRVPQMSPMHPPKPVETVEEETTSWVGRRVDALFSPVLNLFGGAHGVEADDDEEHVVTDEDVAMTTEVPHEEDDEELHQQQEPLVPPPSSSASTATATAPPSMTPTAQEQPEQIVVTKSSEDEGELEEDPSSDDDEDDFNPYLFIKSLPRYEAVRHLRPSIALPPKHPNAPPVTLVLDLDETLVHCTVENCTDADLTFPVVFHGVSYQVHVRLRPFLFEFLEAIHDKFEVVVFTASQRVYADELLDRIDPSKCLVVCVTFVCVTLVVVFLTHHVSFANNKSTG
jgi:hypothetical protein